MVDRPDRGQCQHIRGDVGELFLALIFEDVVGNPVGLVERCAVDGGESGKILLRGRPFPRKIFIGKEIAQPVGITIIAAEHPGQGIAPQIGLVARLEQSVEPLSCILGLCTRRGRHGRRHGGGRGWGRGGAAGDGE